VAAILTCSYLLGDAAARQSMGLLLQHGVGWRALFVFGASVAGLMFLANLLFLRESRTDEGHQRRWRTRATCSAQSNRARRILWRWCGRCCAAARS